MNDPAFRQALPMEYHHEEQLHRLVPYAAGRALQEAAAAECAAGGPERLILLDHTPTLSLGKRTRAESLRVPIARWTERGFEIASADRGGGPTLHLPGQVVLYPVISLRRRALGVRSFVERGLAAIAAGTAELGVEAVARLEPAGVWVLRRSADTLESVRKLASVGIRVRDGVTLHGFAVNVTADLEPFADLDACGLCGVAATSLAAELRAGQRFRPEEAVPPRDPFEDDTLDRAANVLGRCFREAFELDSFCFF